MSRNDTLPESRTPNSTVLALCSTELFALGSLIVPISIGLALKVRTLDTGMSNEAALSIVTAAGAAAAMFANPVFGWWSDRSLAPNRSRWILGGAAAGALVAPAVLTVNTVAGLTVVWCLLQIAYNATFAGLYGTIADVVPEADRSRVSGFFAASASASFLVGLGIAAVLPKAVAPLFLVMPSVAVVVACGAYLVLRRLWREHLVRAAGGWRHLVSAPSQYWWVWFQRLLSQLAYVIASIFGVFYLIRRAGLDDAGAATWVAATGATAAGLSVVAAICAGQLAKRSASYGPYMFLGLSLVGSALAVKSVTSTPAAFVVATLLAGLGSGAYYAVDLALVLRTLPAASAGALLGFFNISRTLPQSLAPLFAPPLLQLGSGDIVGADRTQNYFALYATGLLVVAAAMILIIPIRVRHREFEGVLSLEKR